MYGLLNDKAQRGVEGRKQLFQKLEKEVGRLGPTSKRIWFHSSSMGEFEQAKPIIAELKKRHPEIDIIVSFFSPSGYEHSQTYKLATIITYLPFDSSSNAKRFIELIRPTAAVIVRYDIWPNHIWELHHRNIPIFIASATLRANTIRKIPLLREFHRSLYNMLNYILAVSEDDKRTFESFRLLHPVLEVVGDTRYDQVLLQSIESKRRQVLPSNVIENKKVLIAGSTWREDEEHLLSACKQLIKTHADLLVIIVPHEPTLEHLERLENALNGYARHIRFSELMNYQKEQVIIIDSVGILMALYQYAYIAFVGGSFSSGVHNVLEPAAYGAPVVVGPNHENSQEALSMVREGVVVVGENADELSKHFKKLLDDLNTREHVSQKLLSLLQRNAGATGRILSYLEKVL